MKRCEPFQDFSGRQFYIPMDNGRSLGTGTNGNPCSFKPTTSSLNWSEGFASVDTRYQLSQNHSIGYSSFEKQFLEPAPTTYARPDFVPYTQPSHSFIPKPKYVTPIVDSSLQGNISKQQVVGKVLSEASKYGLNTVGYQSQVNKMSTDDLLKQYQNWKVLEKQITVGKVLSEADKYGLNNSVYQQQVNTMSDYELSKQYQEWRALEKRILVGKVLTQYSEATGKSIDEIDEQTKSDLNNADQASLEKIYEDNIKNKQVVLVGTILSQVNEISGKPLNELDQETIDFVNNSELATLQLIYNTNVNQKQLLENGTVGLYELYFRLPVNVSYNILYNPGHFNSDISKLLTRKLDLNNISNLNLSNNQIGDDVAKLLADSLSKGEMPNLKKLHLEGNKITSEGVSYYLDNLKKDQLNNTHVSFTAPKSTIDKIMEFFGKGSKYYVNEFHKNQQSSKEADIAVNGKDGFGHCVQVVRTAGIDVASAIAQKAIAIPPIVKKAVEKSPAPVKLIVGGGLVVSSLNEVKGAFLSEDFAYCMAWFNQEIIGDNGHENSDM